MAVQAIVSRRRHAFGTIAGLRRSPATMSGFHQGRPPQPGPPTVEEIIAVMRAAGDRPDGLRLRGVIVVLWRA
jgi:hypothetical protein